MYSRDIALPGVPRRRGLTRFLIPCLALLAFGALFLAACGGDDDDDEGGDSEGSSSFPVTIKHKYGETEIKEQPVRVVSVGYSEQDTLLGLGVKPVGVRDWYGDYPYATWPWAQDELGDAKPTVLSNEELDFEAISGLDPDLIVGVTSGMTKDEYETLSKIAPTIAQPGEFVDYGTPWRDEVRMIGKALGLDSKAEAAIADIESQFAAVKKAHPEFAGKTTGVSFYFSDMPGAYSSQDARSRLMQDLGFIIPPKFDELAGTNFYFSVSQEQITVLDTEVIVWIASTDEGLVTIKNMPLRPTLDAVDEGREVFVGHLLGGAFSFGSLLSMPYLLENLVPSLALAVDGNPTTKVP